MNQTGYIADAQRVKRKYVKTSKTVSYGVSISGRSIYANLTVEDAISAHERLSWLFLNVRMEVYV